MTMPVHRYNLEACRQQFRRLANRTHNPNILMILPRGRLERIVVAA